MAVYNPDPDCGGVCANCGQCQNGHPLDCSRSPQKPAAAVAKPTTPTTPAFLRTWDRYGETMARLARFPTHSVRLRTPTFRGDFTAGALSRDGHNTSSTRLKLSTDSKDELTVGVNLVQTEQGPRPSAFVEAKSRPVANPWSATTIAVRLSKAPWRTMPYAAVTSETRTSALALKTTIGSNPGDKMNQSIRERQEVPDLACTQAVSVGTGPWLLGGSLTTHVAPVGAAANGSAARFADYEAGIEYVQPTHAAGIRAVDKLQTLRAYWWSELATADARLKMRAGQSGKYNSVTGESVARLVLDTKMTLVSPHTNKSISLGMRAKMNTNQSATLGFSVQDKLTTAYGNVTGGPGGGHVAVGCSFGEI